MAENKQEAQEGAEVTPTTTYQVNNVKITLAIAVNGQPFVMTNEYDRKWYEECRPTDLAELGFKKIVAYGTGTDIFDHLDYVEEQWNKYGLEAFKHYRNQ